MLCGAGLERSSGPPEQTLLLCHRREPFPGHTWLALSSGHSHFRKQGRFGHLSPELEATAVKGLGSGSEKGGSRCGEPAGGEPVHSEACPNSDSTDGPIDREVVFEALSAELGTLVNLTECKLWLSEPCLEPELWVPQHNGSLDAK